MMRNGNVRKPAIRGTNGNVENQVKRLVKGRVGAAGAAPGIDGDGAVDGFTGKFTIAPEILVFGKVKEHDVL